VVVTPGWGPPYGGAVLRRMCVRSGQCMFECQSVITEARVLLRCDAPSIAHLTDGHPLPVIVSRAYARMGNAYKRLGRTNRAVNAYLLALKENPGNDQVGADPAPGHSLCAYSAEVSHQARAQLAKTLKEVREAGPKTEGAAVADIEDITSRHMLLGYQESFKFQCTK
jgi:tetratricopeptide (TPR) repeat protein